VIYLDNAATSWPKPDCVPEAMLRYLRDVGASPGRSGHRLALAAERIRLDARLALAELFGVSDPLRIVFMHNATTALNVVLHGLLPPGSHVITTGMEHNAVMRPLQALAQRGVTVTVVACHADGTLAPTVLDACIQPATRLIVATHASNVCGTVLPIREMSAIAKQRGIPLLVDAAQTAGGWPIDLRRDGIDLLAFSGHKGLLGPSGTGGLAINDAFDVKCLPPLLQGGTGSRSEHEEHPADLPDRYEPGTPNMPGIAGLAAAARYVLETGVARIRTHERMLTQRLIDGLRGIVGVRVHGTQDAGQQTAVVAFTLVGQSVSDVAQALDERFGVLCRPGLHCAPRAHRTLGTFPHGTLRFAPGLFTTLQEADTALAAVAELAETTSRG